MELISREQALEAFGLSEKTRKYGGDHSGYDTMMMYEIQDTIEDLPPIQPEIIHCKDCRKHNKKLGIDENYNITYKDDACPLIPWRGMSKGHEHDYQSCCFGERKEVTT